MPKTLLYKGAIRDLRGPDLLPLNPTEPLLPWADIPHILHRGPLPVSLFRNANGQPLLS